MPKGGGVAAPNKAIADQYLYLSARSLNCTPNISNQHFSLSQESTRHPTFNFRFDYIRKRKNARCSKKKQIYFYCF